MHSGFGGGADLMFSIMPVFMVIIFVVVIGGFIVAFVQGIGQWHKNNQSPRLTVYATVVSKRENVSRHHHGSVHDHHHHHTSYSTSYYVTFEVPSGDRMEFHVTGEEYGLLVEGDQGELTFQGTRYQGFVRTV